MVHACFSRIQQRLGTLLAHPYNSKPLHIVRKQTCTGKKHRALLYTSASVECIATVSLRSGTAPPTAAVSPLGFASAGVPSVAAAPDALAAAAAGGASAGFASFLPRTDAAAAPSLAAAGAGSIAAFAFAAGS